MKLLFSGLIFFLQAATFAQVSTSLDVRLPTDNGFGSVKYNNPSEIGQKTEVNLNDDEIRGTAFWKNDWNKAYVFLTSSGVVKLNQAKLNLKTNEIYFSDSSNTIKVADASIINRIIFIDKKDSGKTAVFQKLNYDGNVFFQILNAGDYQLLKAIIVSVNKRDYNTLSGKDEYAYDSKPVYYLFHAGTITKIDAFNKEHLGYIIYFKLQDNNWLEQNKNKLKSESDWISFLNYYNSKS